MATQNTYVAHSILLMTPRSSEEHFTGMCELRQVPLASYCWDHSLVMFPLSQVLYSPSTTMSGQTTPSSLRDLDSYEDVSLRAMRR